MKLKTKAFLLFCLTVGLLAPTLSLGNQGENKIPKCKGSSELVGGCFKFHGRMSLYNGSLNVRIWRMGTNRLLGVALTRGSSSDEHPDGEYWMPAKLSKTLDFGVDIFGDFEVCPLTKQKPEEMQLVCVESASHLVVRDNRSEEEKKPNSP